MSTFTLVLTGFVLYIKKKNKKIHFAQNLFQVVYNINQPSKTTTSYNSIVNEIFQIKLGFLVKN